MGYIRKPSYFFLSEAETGIDALSLGSIISVASFSGVPKQFQKNSLGTLTSTSTIANAVTSGDIIELGSGGGGTLSVTNNTSTDTTFYPLFVDVVAGTPTVNSVSSTKLNFNPSSGNFSSTTFTSLSDVNKKDNIITISNAMSVIDTLRGVTFNWKDNGKESSGVIAQELETVLPYLVETSNEDKTVNYMGIIGFLIEGMKELKKEIEELKK